MRWPRSSRISTRSRDADVIYSDEDKLDLAGARCDPYFKPDWSPEHFLTCMYTCHFMVVRRTPDERRSADSGTGYEGAQDYDLLLRLMERTSADRTTSRASSITGGSCPESTASAGQAKPWALDAGRLALEDYVRRSGHRRRGAAGRRAGPVPRPAPDSRHAARVAS